MATTRAGLEDAIRAYDLGVADLDEFNAETSEYIRETDATWDDLGDIATRLRREPARREP